MTAALVGVAGRWRHIAVMGEVNVARTPSMTFGGKTFASGVHVLPMVSVRGIIPVGG